MKLLVVGSRSIRDLSLEEWMPKEVSLLISGGANGVDTIAEAWADAHRISKLILRPDYRRYGRGAPLKRNEQMVQIADALLVIWDGRSPGTRYTADYAKKLGKPVTLITLQF